MKKRIALLATVAALSMGSVGVSGALADDTTTITPPPAEITTPAADAPSSAGVGIVEAEAPATPPPSDAVIPAQRANEVRAETLIGATVFSPDGDKVGTVKDILFDTSGKATGVVLSVGGIMGLGAKSVGLTWEEVDVQPDPKLLQVKYTEDQLEAAPTFKTQEAQQAEADAARMEQQQPAAPMTTAPAPAPATTE
ncbi:MAG: PRC-barrel domain-containing protein [Rhodospirillaceae bacterium]|nr:PRC-barrel domain-containing protein [Rhodospirillaceae bacterium]